MYERYTDIFLNSGRATEKKGYSTLFNKLENYNKFILNWTNQDLDNFIKLQNSKSENAINKCLQFTRCFHKYISEQECIEYKKLKLQYDAIHYINEDKLRDVTLSYMDYSILKRLLIEEIGDKTYNNRDASILILAWHGVSPEEIKDLLKIDIVFYELLKVKKCQIKLKNRYIIIEDKDEIIIIKNALNEYNYFIPSTDKRKERFPELKDTPYFIRAVDTKKGNKNIEKVANPSQILKRALEKVDIISPGSRIQLSDLSLEDITRSRKIDLLRKNNVTTKDIVNMFGKINECDSYWLSRIAVTMEREQRERQRGS